MFTKIIVGVDGNEGGRDAMALAELLADPGTDLLFVHAYPYEQHIVSRASVGGYEELLREDATSLLAAAAEGRRGRTRVIPDVSPARSLHALAHSEQADLIVVGSCHRGRVGRVLLGDVSRATLHGAPCPVAIAPRGYHERTDGLGRIGVAYHATPESEAALAFADQLAQETGATLRLRTVVNAPAAYPAGYTFTYDWSPFREEQRRRAQQHMDEAIAGLTAKATGDVVEGPTALELEDLSKLVDLLIAGSRGWGTAFRVVLGSTTDRLTHHASCPMIVVATPVTKADKTEDRHGALAHG